MTYQIKTKTLAVGLLYANVMLPGKKVVLLFILSGIVYSMTIILSVFELPLTDSLQ